jgi:hypothetical protein
MGGRNMDRRRSISIVVLAALLLAQALPARAGAMLCPMKKKEAAAPIACMGCDASRPSDSNGLLRARSCCQMRQDESRDALPVVLTVSRRAVSFEPQSLLVTPVPLLAGAVPSEPVRAIAWSGPPPVSLLASSIPSTILRN